jgi:hypothetical protein
MPKFIKKIGNNSDSSPSIAVAIDYQKQLIDPAIAFMSLSPLTELGAAPG